jgi:hypothetical protein
VTEMSQSRDRRPSSTPGNSVSRTQCRLHARAAQEQGARPLVALRRVLRNPLPNNHFASFLAHRAHPGTRIADYRSESVRSGRLHVGSMAWHGSFPEP